MTGGRVCKFSELASSPVGKSWWLYVFTDSQGHTYTHTQTHVTSSQNFLNCVCPVVSLAPSTSTTLQHILNTLSTRYLSTSRRGYTWEYMHLIYSTNISLLYTLFICISLCGSQENSLGLISQNNTIISICVLKLFITCMRYCVWCVAITLQSSISCSFKESFGENVLHR